jgi:DNA-binding PucR family transcriptional regulator
VRMLDENDRRLGTKLVGTLETFLACDRSPSLTARRLGIHRNTLAKRLRRAESLLGATLTDTDTLVAVGLGLSARSLLAGRKRASQATMGEP